MAVDWDALVIGPTIEVFGDPVIYRPGVGGTLAVTGVFDKAYMPLRPLGSGSEPDLESNYFGSPGAITTARPVLGVQLSQFSVAPEPGDTLTVEGGNYVVKEVRPDGRGGAALMLNGTT